jgi:hypothetical protein
VVTEGEAKAIARSVGKPTLEFAASIVAPLYWLSEMTRAS